MRSMVVGAFRALPYAMIATTLPHAPPPPPFGRPPPQHFVQGRIKEAGVVQPPYSAARLSAPGHTQSSEVQPRSS